MTELSIYVQNVATMLGLALAIDYSLFMVSRFREELRKGRDVETAVEITVATSGKAVAFSGLAVAIGLSGLLLFEPTALRSFGIGGSLVVAVVGLLRADVPAGRRSACSGRASTRSASAALRDRVRRLLGRPDGVAADAARESRWERIAHWVMARPVVVLIPTLAFLLLLGTPFLRLDAGHPGRVGPARGHREPRRRRSPSQTTSARARPRRSSILATVDGLADRRRERPAASSTTRGASTRVDGIDRVEGPFADLKDPPTGADARRRGHRRPVRRAARPAPAGARRRPRPARDAYIRGSTVRLDAISPLAPSARPAPRSSRRSAASHVDGVTAAGRRPRRPGPGLHGQPVAPRSRGRSP